MIAFTEKAIEILKDAVKSPDMIRVSVKGGGCSGFMYDVAIESQPRENDTIIDFEEDDLKICIDPKSAFMLDETTVDYESTLAQSGFKFYNKQASKTCGCGQSFN
tara:strand:+ start:8283 stop:8597 length:315 start_codon:yes stop_codon:yes gene_type:complete